MSNVHSCPSCGTALGGHAAEGLCPSCLLKAALGDPEPAPALEPVPAGRIFGDYQIRGPLGQGGMGVVYAARQISLNRPVALKMVRSPHLASGSELARFRQEAEAAARLDHPNIVPVYEAGERDGVQYFTMKLVEGARSLASDLSKGPMKARAAAKLMLKIARAVHYAHQRGVIHRDIKPANILMDRSGEPQLADFGLAKLQETTVSLTQGDHVIGTPQYMSPEQVHGHSRDLTAASDIYSLGAVLYEMLTGRPPFRSESVHELLRLVAEKDPKPPRQLNTLIDKDLQTICLKCLEKLPSSRYVSANHLADDLENWLTVRPINARPATSFERVKKWGKRNPVVAALAASLLLVALLAGILVRVYREAGERARLSLVRELNQLCSEASASRSSPKEGRRWDAMAKVGEALKIMARPELPKDAVAHVTPALRNEVIACLSLVDARPAEHWRSDTEATLSPDFSRYAEIFSDGRIVISSVPDRQELFTVNAGPAAPSGVRFVSGGRQLAYLTAAKSKKSRLIIGDESTGKTIFETQGPDRGVFDINADGSRLALVAAGEVRVLETGTGKVLVRLPSGANPEMLRFSPDGRRLAVLRRDEHVSIVDAATGTVISTCQEDHSARCISWEPGGRWLAIGGFGKIFVWDTLHPDEDHPVRMWPADGAIENLAWHPNGRLLASESDGTVVLWNARTGSLQVSSSVQSQNGLQFSLDGTQLGLFRHGDQLTLLEVDPATFGRHASGHPGRPISGVAWSHDAGRVLATAADDAVRFWNRDGESVGMINVKGARSVLWNRDSLIVTGLSGIMRWPLTKSDDGRSPQVLFGPMKMIDERPGWERAAMSMPDRDGKFQWIAVTHPERTLLLKADGGRPTPELTLQRGADFVAISRDDRWLATGGRNGQGVRVWSLPDGAPVAVIPVSGSANVGFSIDGGNLDHSEWLVTGNDVEYCFWKTGDWKQKGASFRTQLGASYYGAMAFSSRGTALALESERHQIKIIYPHPDSGLLPELAAPDFARQSPLSFSPKGGLLVDVDAQSHIIFWDLAWLREKLKPLGLDWERFDKIEDPELPLVEEVTVESGP